MPCFDHATPQCQRNKSPTYHWPGIDDLSLAAPRCKSVASELKGAGLFTTSGPIASLGADRGRCFAATNKPDNAQQWRGCARCKQKGDKAADGRAAHSSRVGRG